MKLTHFLAAAALLAPLASHAGVIYEWQALDDGRPRDITLRLEFTQQTVDSGAFSLRLPFQDSAPSYPDSGLVSLYYSFPGSYLAMNYMPQVERFRDGLGSLEMDIFFEPSGYLSGWIRANDQNSHIVLGSDGLVFTVQDANSDQGMPQSGCDWSAQVACAGAAGVLRDVRVDAGVGMGVGEVPEPHAAALLAAGAFGAAGALRLRRRRT